MSSTHLAQKEWRDVHVGSARARADSILRHLEGLGYRVGAFETHALRGHRVAADEDDFAYVIEGVGCPVEHRERVGAVVGIGVSVEGAVPGVEGVLLLVAVVDLVYVVGLWEDLVPEVYVRGMVTFVEPGWHGVGPDEHASLAHERLAPVKVEEVAEEHVEDEERVHDRVHV